MKSALTLTFHKINAAPTQFKSIPNSAADRYAITSSLFEQVLNMIPCKKCCTVSNYVEEQDGNWLILTFDDGNLSDFEIAFPMMREKGIKATFFINPLNIGLSGYSTGAHLKEMAREGMEIGSHGLTHRYLITMEQDEAIREIRESKDKLEQIIGVRVFSFAPVGGHYRKWMKETAYEAGYKVFATMVPGTTNGGGDFLLLKRNHIQSQHDADYLLRLIGGDYGTLTINRLRYNLLQIPKIILGINNYDLLKKYLFGH